MSYIKITPQEENEIIIFYTAPNTLSQTCKRFHRHPPAIKRVLAKHNIKEHTKELEHLLVLQMRKKTNLDKYGHENAGQFGSIEHTKAIMAKYGVINVFQADCIKEKIKATCLEKYGTVSPMQSVEVQNKLKQTKQIKYGDPNFSNRDKARTTNKAKYGVETYFNSAQYKQFMQEHRDEIRQKREQLCLKRYGVRHTSQRSDIRRAKQLLWQQKTSEELQQIREKYKKTSLYRFGATSYSQTVQAHRTRQSRYKYENIFFDSFPELAFYLYHITYNINIIRCPVRLPFVYNNHTYYYMPDFEVDGQLVELKGSCFRTDIGTWQNPFDHSKDLFVETKHQCALANNVKILYTEDYVFYTDWFVSNGYKKTDYLLKTEEQE